MEDDLVSASALGSILRRRGFEVTHVTTIAKAIEGLAHQPALIILDLMLPDGNGIAVLQEIRTRGLSSRVLVVSAVNDPDQLTAVKNLEPEIIMPKPIDLPRLLSLLGPLH